MNPSLIVHFAEASGARHQMNLQDEAAFPFSSAFSEQKKFHQANPVEKPDTCPHLKTLAKKMPTYGRQTL
jgi:hypothetical protein